MEGMFVYLSINKNEHRLSRIMAESSPFLCTANHVKTHRASTSAADRCCTSRIRSVTSRFEYDNASCMIKLARTRLWLRLGGAMAANDKRGTGR